MQESNKVANAGLKTKPQPGTKIRCVDVGGLHYLTQNKVYEVQLDDCEDNSAFFILDDNNDPLWHTIGQDLEKFELVQEEEAQMTTTEQTPDEFKVGDTVWCLMRGKGKVVMVLTARDFAHCPIIVDFKQLIDPVTGENRSNRHSYSKDGKWSQEFNRTLFFSEPKIEASVKRPFTPTLVGKTVVVQPKEYSSFIGEIVDEDEQMIWYTPIGLGTLSYQKRDIKFIYEVLPENLLKP